jgi:hypothetical protein
VRLAWVDPHSYSRAKVASAQWGLAKRPECFHGHRLHRSPECVTEKVQFVFSPHSPDSGLFACCSDGSVTK